MLWFGWFGFNAGSWLLMELPAWLLKQYRAAAGAMSWVAAEWIHHGKPTVFGGVSGAVAGLVAITPAAGFVSPLSAVVMGIMVGPISYLFVSKIKQELI